MPTKDELIAQGKWDIFKDKPYEDRIVQASQFSTQQRSFQVMGDLEEDWGREGQTEAGSTPPGCGQTCPRAGDALQIKKEAFCVVEEMVKYMGNHGHHLSHAYGVGYNYLKRVRPEIS